MNTFKKLLLHEMFNSPVNFYHSIDRGKYTYNFNINNNEVNCIFDVYNDEETIYSIDFQINGRSERFGNDIDSKDTISLFSTLKEIVKDFVQKEHPEGLAFYGVGNSRRKLYQSFAIRISRYYNTHRTSHDGNYIIVFI